jgi:uncharacterized membrane protein
VDTLHHILVHFPIALLTTAWCFQIAADLRRDDRISLAAWWVQSAGTAGLAFAVASGLLAKEQIAIRPEGAPALAAHEQLALLVAGLFAGLFFWRLSLRGKPPEGRRRVLFIVLMAASVLLMWLGAWNGGEIAHRFRITPD